jgi:hypothetical protein
MRDAVTTDMSRASWHDGKTARSGGGGKEAETEAEREAAARERAEYGKAAWENIAARDFFDQGWAEYLGQRAVRWSQC